MSYPVDQCMEIKADFFAKKRKLIFLLRVSDEYYSLHEHKKSDLECDERENDHWQRAILYVKKRIRLITKRFNIIIYPDISAETALGSTGTMKEAQRAAAFKYTSLKFVKTNFSTVAEEDEDYKIMFFLLREVKL